MSEPDTISDEEAYALSYRVFWEAVSMLALDADGQCEAMGNYNVAWELKDDVSAGTYLFNSPVCPLSPLQREGINELISALASIPSEVLAQATSAASNKKAMGHACWEPIRVKAAQVLRALPEPDLGA
jgi:hypothetical protein